MTKCSPSPERPRGPCVGACEVVALVEEGQVEAAGEGVGEEVADVQASGYGTAALGETPDRVAEVDGVGATAR